MHVLLGRVDQINRVDADQEVQAQNQSHVLRLPVEGRIVEDVRMLTVVLVSMLDSILNNVVMFFNS